MIHHAPFLRRLGAEFAERSTWTLLLPCSAGRAIRRWSVRYVLPGLDDVDAAAKNKAVLNHNLGCQQLSIERARLADLSPLSCLDIALQTPEDRDRTG